MRILILLLGLALAAPVSAQSSGGAPEGMVLVEGGIYTPLYKGAASQGAVDVAPFYLDVRPVTNAEFLAFVEANPSWRRSRVASLFADERYLVHWRGDLDPGEAAVLAQPVVNVSWFAAEAYAEWKGRRLPTVAEWEYAAAAGADRPDGYADPAFAAEVLARYSRRGDLRAAGSGPANYWGLRDVHGLVWEWTHDFNSALVTGESRNDASLDLERFCGAASLGASDFRDYAAFLRFALRSGLEAGYTVANLGFRLAADAHQ